MDLAMISKTGCKINMIYDEDRKEKVHLVLPTSGAREMGQTGVTEVLEETGRGLSDLGAVAGGIYAAGFQNV